MASISQWDFPTIRGNCLNSASMSDPRCPQIVISFKLLSGEVQVKDIFTLSFPVITSGFICSDLTEDGYIHMYLGSLEFLKKEKETHTY